MTYYHFTDQVQVWITDPFLTFSDTVETIWVSPKGSSKLSGRRQGNKHSNYREAKESGLQSPSRLSSVPSRSCSFPPATRESLPAAPTGFHHFYSRLPCTGKTFFQGLHLPRCGRHLLTTHPWKLHLQTSVVKAGKTEPPSMATEGHWPSQGWGSVWGNHLPRFG